MLGHIEFGAQRPPDLARVDTILDRLGAGAAVHRGQDMIGQQQVAAGDAEFGMQEFLEFSQPHRAEGTGHRRAAAIASAPGAPAADRQFARTRSRTRWQTSTGSSTSAADAAAAAARCR